MVPCQGSSSSSSGSSSGSWPSQPCHGSARAAAQAFEAGLLPERITRTSGMVLHPRFYPRPGPEVRARVRGELGLDESAFVVLILFGGKGSPEIHALSEALLHEPGAACVIAICGDNPSLYRALEEVESRAGAACVVSDSPTMSPNTCPRPTCW